MNSQIYIEKRDGGYWIAGTRVSLDSLVYRFLEGLSPETIQAECFPTLNLEQVYGAITYYLAYRDEVDAYLKDEDSDFEAFRLRIREGNPAVSRRLDQILQNSEALRP